MIIHVIPCFIRRESIGRGLYIKYFLWSSWKLYGGLPQNFDKVLLKSYICSYVHVLVRFALPENSVCFYKESYKTLANFPGDLDEKENIMNIQEENIFLTRNHFNKMFHHLLKKGLIFYENSLPVVFLMVVWISSIYRW